MSRYLVQILTRSYKKGAPESLLDSYACFEGTIRDSKGTGSSIEWSAERDNWGSILVILRVAYHLNFSSKYKKRLMDSVREYVRRHQ